MKTVDHTYVIYVSQGNVSVFAVVYIDTTGKVTFWLMFLKTVCHIFTINSLVKTFHFYFTQLLYLESVGLKDYLLSSI